jgi:nanoRNase/pAp phosphatase (c-di-AMP/oligoRNAs hydrolase)
LQTLEGPVGERLGGLIGALRSIDGHLGVFTHDNPDPDAIGSAIALRDLARARGIDADAYYFGQITHQENRAMVNLLDIQIENLDADEYDPENFDAIALVDHSRPGVNDQLPLDTQVDIVIDHHPPRAAVDAGFIDLRSDVGATSTLMADYFRQLDIPVTPQVATALLFGIRVDTKDFGREITEADFQAAAFLLPFADDVVLERIESPSISGATLDTIAEAIRNRIQHDSVVLSGVGSVTQRDSLAQAADHLLGMEGITTTVVYGIKDGTVYASARTRGTVLDIGETMREAFDRIGSAGGHTDMAGAQIPLGILGEIHDDDIDGQLESVVEDVITNRFFEVVNLQRAYETNETGSDQGRTAE